MLVGVFNTAGNRAYSAATDKTVKIWDLALAQVLRSIAVGSEITDLCVVWILHVIVIAGQRRGRAVRRVH